MSARKEKGKSSQLPSELVAESCSAGINRLSLYWRWKASFKKLIIPFCLKDALQESIDFFFIGDGTLCTARLHKSKRRQHNNEEQY